MKKCFLLFALALVSLAMNAQKKTDPVVMTIADKPVLLSEFLFIAQKDSGVDLKDAKSLNSYVELFKNFKLKVADAEAAGIDKTEDFIMELNGYRTQLRASFLTDKAGEEAAIKDEYERTKEELLVSHILFALPVRSITKDTVEVYQKAKEAYDRIRKGESFKAVGEKLAEEQAGKVSYEESFYLKPLKTPKAFENAAYSLPEGEVSLPVRSSMGFHLIKVEKRIPSPGLIEVAHILINTHEKRTEEEAKKTAEEVYNLLQNGGDFAELAKKYSADATASNGGVLPAFGLGEMVKPFEEAAFVLKKSGELSRPVETRYGFHIIKLIKKVTLPSFDSKRAELYSGMRQGEWNFELYDAYDKKMKKAYGYVFYKEAFDDFRKLGDDYFPTDTTFYQKSMNWEKPLFRLNGEDHLQKEYAYYIHRNPFSTKTYSGDFLQEVYDLLVRDIYTELERATLDTHHPEFNHLMQEYHDGILLFEISNQRVWSKPAAEQEQLEAEWIKELNKKYPVTIDRKVLKNMNSYLPK